MMSPRAEASTSKPYSEVYCRKFGATLTTHVKCPPGKGKAITPDKECQAGLPKSPKIPSAEELRVIMEAASRGALEAFHDFSSQFHSDLRDDISHQLESVEAQLESVNLQMQEARRPKVKGETFKNCPNAESNGEASRLDTPRPLDEGQGSPETPLLETYPDARWPPSPPSPRSPASPSPPSDEAKMIPRSQLPEDERGQFGIWELNRLRNQRSQGSPHGIHSVRSKSTLLFQDLLQEEMRPDSDPESSQHAKMSPRTLEPPDSFQKSSVSDGYGSGHQTYTSRGQRSPSPHGRKVTHVLVDFNSQPQGSESGRFRTSPPWQDESRRIGLNPGDSSDDSFQKISCGGSSESAQQLQDSIEAWKKRGPKMGQTQNLEADLKSSQISETKFQVGGPGGPSESADGTFHAYNVLHRPSRMPHDIWPNFPQAESSSRRNPTSLEVREDSRGECTGQDLVYELKEEILVIPNIQRMRGFKPDQISPPVSPSPCQSSKTYKKILKLKSHSPTCSPSQRELVGGLRSHVTSSSKTLDETSSKLESEGTSSSPISGSPSFSLDQASGSPLSAGYSLDQCSNSNVVLDLKHEIAPGVFHCRQGNQTRVIINIPKDVEALNESRRQLRSLLRKDEIYKEFKLLGIQKPPTEDQILEDFAVARYRKHLETVSETKPPRKSFPVYQPYYADGKVWAPHAGPFPIVDRYRFETADAQSVDSSFLTQVSARPLSESRAPSGQSIGHSSETPVLDGRKVTSQRRSPSSQITRTRSQSEQQLSVMNSCKGDESPTISDGLRGAMTSRELTAYDLATLASWGGLKGHQGSGRSRAQTTERSTSRHGSAMQKREILNTGYGRKSSYVQPSSSPQRKAEPQLGASGLIETSSRSLVTSSTDNSSREHTPMDSGNSFPQEERLDEIGSGFSITPLNFKTVHANFLKTNSSSVVTCPNESRQPEEVSPRSSFSITPLNFKTVHADLLKTNNSSVVTRPNESRQPEEVSPRSSLDNSIDNVLSNLSKFSEEMQWLDITFKRPTSREHSLDEVVRNIPSDSGSSDFDPYRSSGKLGSIAGSTGSHTDSVPSFRDLLIFYNPSQLAPAEETTSPPVALCYSITDVSHTAQTKQADIIHSPLMYPDDSVEAERISNSIRSNCQNCPFGQYKEVDEFIHSSDSGSPGFPHRLNVRVSWADEKSISPQCTSKCEELVSTPPPRTTRTLNAILDGMSQELKDIKAKRSNYNVRLEEALPKNGSALDTNAQQSNLNVRLEVVRPRKIKALDNNAEQSDVHIRSEDSGRRTKSTSTIEGKRQLNEKPRNSLKDVKLQRSLDWETEKRQIDEKLQKINNAKMQKSLKLGKEKIKKAKTLRDSCSETELHTKSIPDAKSRNNYKDATTQTDFSEQDEVAQLSRSPQPSQTPRLSGVEGYQIRESTKNLGSNENVPDFLDDQNYSKMLNDIVGQRGDRESINSFKARKKRVAEDLAFRTRQSAQMLESMINVREFADDSRSYSVWLDGAAQTPESNGRMSSETQTPKIVELSGNGEPLELVYNAGSQTQIPGNVLESSESGESSEALDRREPRFREDSAANFIGRMKMQILQEFSDPKNSGSDGQDQIQGPGEPKLRENSASNFLGALSQQIVQQFTEHMTMQSQGQGESEGTREPRFREQSALNFLSDLSEQLLTEFEDRSTSQTSTSSMSDPREPRFRENSAINFLSALRGQVIQRSRQSSISERASSSGQHGQTSYFMPPRYSENLKQSEDQAYVTDGVSNPESDVNRNPTESVDSQTPTEIDATDEDVSYQLDPMNQAYLTDDGNHQLNPESQALLGEGLGSQPNTESQAFLGESLDSQPGGEGQEYRVEGLSRRKSQSQDSRSQLVPQVSRKSLRGSRNAVPDADQESQNQAFVRSGSRQYSQSRMSQSQLIAAEAQSSRRSSQNAVPDAESQTVPGESSGSQPNVEGQEYPVEGLSYPDDALSDQPDVEGELPDAEDQAFPGEDYGFEPDAEYEAFPAEGFHFQAGAESQEYPVEGSSDQPLGAEGQGYTDEGLSSEPHPEGQDCSDDGLDYQSEDNPSESESLNYQPSEPGEGNTPADGAFDTTTHQESQNQSFLRSASRQYSQSRNSQSLPIAPGSRNSRRSSQNAVFDEMLEDMQTTISRSRQNSSSNQG